jgi:hypothetical protein
MLTFSFLKKEGDNGSVERGRKESKQESRT